MSPRVSFPKYGLHKASGQAVAYVNRRAVYLGVYDTPESRRRYGELIAGLAAAPIASAAPTAPASAEPPTLTVNELCLKWMVEVAPKYKTAEGKPSAEVAMYAGMIKILRRLFGDTPAGDFGPVRLRAVRSEMVAAGWTRNYINKEIHRLKALFKFGVSWDLVPAVMIEKLRSVPSLEAGETAARETKPKGAIPLEDLKLTRAKLQPRHRDIFDLLLLTGARSGELMALTSGDIDRTVSPWRADLERHKTARHGKSRTLFFNAAAQAILQKYLKVDPNKKLFPINRQKFSEVLGRASVRAGVPRFTAHSLRHCVATRLANELGLESAQRLLGHSNSAMTAHYSRLADATAIAAAEALGNGDAP